MFAQPLGLVVFLIAFLPGFRSFPPFLFAFYHQVSIQHQRFLANLHMFSAFPRSLLSRYHEHSLKLSLWCKPFSSLIEPLALRCVKFLREGLFSVWGAGCQHGDHRPIDGVAWRSPCQYILHRLHDCGEFFRGARRRSEYLLRLKWSWSGDWVAFKNRRCRLPVAPFTNMD